MTDELREQIRKVLAIADKEVAEAHEKYMELKYAAKELRDSLRDFEDPNSKKANSLLFPDLPELLNKKEKLAKAVEIQQGEFTWEDLQGWLDDVMPDHEVSQKYIANYLMEQINKSVVRTYKSTGGTPSVYMKISDYEKKKQERDSME